MEKEKISSANICEILEIAYQVIQKHKNPIEGVREINNLSFLTDYRDDDIFLGIKAIESETEHFILGDVRNEFSSTALMHIDAEMQSYIGDMEKYIHIILQKIIERFSQEIESS